jgi:hypothetical protein
MAELKTARARPGSGYREVPRDAEPEPLNREQGILGLFQAAAFGVAFVSQIDAAAILYHAPNISRAGAELAANDPRARKLIDRILEVGPYGAFFAAIVPLALQIAANNNRFLKAGEGGTLTEDQLMTAVGAEAESEPSGNGNRPADTGSAGIPN